MDMLSGSVERITFYNPENGYTVLRLRPEYTKGIQAPPKTSLSFGDAGISGTLAGSTTRIFSGWISVLIEVSFIRFKTESERLVYLSAFNLARGIQFLTPVAIALIARSYGLAGGILLAALFALATGAWIWTFPETRGKALML